jgi:hypothetical protein
MSEWVRFFQDIIYVRGFLTLAAAGSVESNRQYT